MYDPTRLFADTTTTFFEEQVFGMLMRYERIRDEEAAKVAARIERAVAAVLVAVKVCASNRQRSPGEILEEAQSSHSAEASSGELAAIVRAAESAGSGAPLDLVFEAAYACLDAEAASDSSSRIAAWNRYRAAVTETRAWSLPTYLAPRLVEWIRSEPGRCLYDLACFG